LGRNGFGKSYLLRFLAALLQKNDEISADFFKNSKNNPFAKLTIVRDGESETILRSKILFEKSIGKVPVLAIPDMRFVDKSKVNISVSDDEQTGLKHHGAYHFLYQKSSEGVIKNFLYELCITYLNEGKRFDLPIFELLHKVIGELSDDEFVFQRIEPIGSAQFQIVVITEGNEKPLPLQQASQGTLSLLAIIGLIYGYLKSVFSNVPEKELFYQPAIVFIDELDAHLHPVWQQKIIRLLRENFPNIQFFVTAHNPLIVAGCKEGEVAVLRKQENGFGIDLLEQDFIGYEAKELYEKIFEIEEKDESYLYYLALSTFQDEIEDKIKYLEEKQKKKPLSTEEERELEQLYDDIYYIEKVNDKYQQRREYSKLLIENRKLKARIRRMESRIEEKNTGDSTT
jgi:ABC-type multidrug transport system ATPase subunit